MDDALRILNETGRWRARNVRYFAGSWHRVREQIPTFSLEPFRSEGDAPANPYLRTVVRQPLTQLERQMPVGVVSNSYALAQHHEVAEKCIAGLRFMGLRAEDLECELGLTELGEWMNLRFCLPDEYGFVPSDKNKMRLRLECSNPVDGSSRLIVLTSWLRLVCSNGMVVRESKTEIKDIHNERLDLERIPEAVSFAMDFVNDDIRRLRTWENESINWDSFNKWIDGVLSDRWGKKAACRVFHVCMSGKDAEFANPFAKGSATEKLVTELAPVPGAPERASSLYDLSQALSWVATSRADSEERLSRQSQIPDLIESLR